MFVRLASVRLKMAETALKDGRLDEAFELANAADLRDHRRAQKVMCRLTNRFRERAERHAKDGRYAEALTDLKKAEVPGVGVEEIADQREQVLSTMQRVRRHEAERRATLEAAGAKFDAGSLAGGNRLLEQVDEGSDVDRLRGHAEHRAASVRKAIDETCRLMEADRLVAAAESLRKAKTLYPRAEGLLEIEATLCDAFLLRVGALIDAGSMSRASDELKVLGDFGRTLPARQELETILSVSADAASALDKRRVADAITALRRLSHLAPNANWVSSALEHLANAQQSLDVVVGGPLGSVQTNGRAAPNVLNAEPRGATREPDSPLSAPADDRTVAIGALPERLLVSVDAGGSYLLVRSPRVTIGRAGIGSTADVPVLADLSDRHLEIARVGEDYFLFAKHPVKIDGRRVTQKLLRDGDRIRVGRRGRLTFRQPSRMSASAILDLGEGLRTIHDVRRVILFDRHALIGPHRRCHIAAKGGEMTLFERGGRLFLRDAENGQAVGGSRSPARAVPLGQFVGEGGVGLSVRRWNNQPSGSGLAGEATREPPRA